LSYHRGQYDDTYHDGVAYGTDGEVTKQQTDRTTGLERVRCAQEQASSNDATNTSDEHI
jgi:hypothetical protein